MVIYIDIDQTICHTVDTVDYSKSVPLKKNIKKAHKLYDDGHTIIYWTARGSVTGVNWRKLTKQQLKIWGVKYHKLKMNKPYYDLFKDDKNLNTKDWI